jgi:hypothetical protein
VSGFDPDEVSNLPQVILFLRENPSWAALCERLGVDPYGEYSTITDILVDSISTLRELEILEFDGGPRLDPRLHDSIRVSSRWTRLQRVLGLSLHDLARISRTGRGLAVTPLFGRPPKTKDHPDIFVIMPFLPDYDDVYSRHIRKVAGELGLSVRRGDERLDSGEIMKAIWDDIFHAKVIVAECTERNANVFYELGIVHTLGRPTVMLRRRGDAAPFDIAGLRWIEYLYTPQGMIEFEERLAAAVKAQLGVPT